MVANGGWEGIQMRFLGILFLLLASGVARADQTGGAKALYQQATAHFAIGEFTKAAEEYEAAYVIKQDPALLFDAAQSRRLAGQNEKALVLFKNYLHIYPSEHNAT